MQNHGIPVGLDPVIPRLTPGRRGRLFTVILSLLSLFTASGQLPEDLKFDRLSSENTIKVRGLSQNSVYCLLQDYKGFIWIGTWDGLNKYNGYDFLVYSNENGLSNTTINTLLEDNSKDLWIGTEKGLNVFRRAEKTIEHFFRQDKVPNSLSHDFINHLMQDGQGYIWIATAYGLNRYDKEFRTFKSFMFFERGQDSSRTNHITRVFQDSKGMFWIGTRNGLHRYDPVQQSFLHYKFSGINGRPADFYLSNTVMDILEDAAGRIIIATQKGIYLADEQTGRTGPLFPQQHPGAGIMRQQINDLHIDPQGNLWIGTDDGLVVYDPGTKEMIRIQAGRSNTSLSNDDIRCIYQDQAGAIWVGTYNGLNKIDQSPARFTHYSHDPQNTQGLSDDIIYAIVEDRDGMVWLGTYDGINKFDRQKDVTSVFRHQPGNQESLSSNKIRGMVFSEPGVLWAGTENGGLNRLNAKTGKVSRFYHDPADSLSISDNFIVSMLCDSKGRIWAGTAAGADLVDSRTGAVSRLVHPPYSLSFRDHYICSVYEDRSGYFWLGTLQGLHRISPDLRGLVVFDHEPANPNSMCPNRVFATFEDRKGIFWFGTMGGGLVRYDPAGQSFRFFTEKNGLPNNVVYAILEDEGGSLWISTNSGLSRFNPATETFVNYDTRDGIQGNEFNAGAYYRNPKGEMFFGGMSGFTVFHPAQITLNMVPPRLVFTRMMVLNETVDDDLSGGEVFSLKYNENVFSIEFSALDYTNPQKNMYRYMLENYDEGWIFSGAGQRRADYRNVRPGTYRFVLHGSNNDGVWNTKGISLTVIIRPPWWQNNILRASVILVTLILLWTIIYHRIRTIKRKNEVQKKMLDIEKQVFEMEQKALQLQMNPHFIFNSLNAIQNFILSNDTDKAVNYLARFSHLMRMILANSSVSLINLKDELKALTYYLDLEKLRFEDKFEYTIRIDPTLDEEFIMIPPMIFQPFVENAVIHGFINCDRPGRLELTFKHLPPESLVCIIQDNGIGREKASAIRAESGIKRQPRGLMITQERMELLKKQSQKEFSVSIFDLKDDYGEPAGTRVEIIIQYKEL